MTFQPALNTHSTRLPSGSSTTLSKYPSPDVRGSPLMVYPALRSFSVSLRTSSLLSSAKAKWVKPSLFSPQGRARY